MAPAAGTVLPPSPWTGSFLLVVVVVSAAACLRIVSAAAPPPDVAHVSGTSGRFFASIVSRGEKARRSSCLAGDRQACSRGGGRNLKCCGRACTDVLSSWHNCGACGARCPFGQLCCGGRCTAVAYDRENCGACQRACPAGLRCTYGMCGYA